MLRIAHNSRYVLPLPKGHRFPMEKYALVPQQLLHEGTCNPDNFFEPGPARKDDILTVHDLQYFKDLMNLDLSAQEIRKIGLPLSQELILREMLIVEGTIRASVYAIEEGVAMNSAGGTHHAYRGSGEGFCIFNDQAIAAKLLQRRGLAQKILIVDLDVHQGNGTAEIFEGDASVFTFSMHGRNNYPFQKENSDLDIELNDRTGDDEYLEILGQNLPLLMEREKPDFVFYLSGVDILSSDKLGKLSCSREGCKKRDRFVLELCHQRRIPVQVSMGGGYALRLSEIVEAHANTFRVAQDIYF